ncbi:hypothetical protein AWQ21_10935 [Picosynechococcus sp. PCC 7003]|uniref:hypothetical protein n=1 Tax=Picosynechococcus sp. PCC 7003 TaxID=374981 RepID=UPI000810DB4F|nr:hypothetical protein [Picosynechococcus sp. PCC 7003]ANV84847.1 hypothetical protein AWQ21_10935 [Picosynechococcus sp. PCC 7003]
MQVWLTSVVVLFIAVQVFQLIKGFFVPLPFYILGGAFLAIASNYDKGIMTVFKSKESPDDQSNTKS